MEDTVLKDLRSGQTTARRKAGVAVVKLPKPVARIAQPAEVWSCSLGATDLACLLQVIEAQLLPRLIGAYRPSDSAPLKTSRSR